MAAATNKTVIYSRKNAVNTLGAEVNFSVTVVVKCLGSVKSFRSSGFLVLRTIDFSFYIGEDPIHCHTGLKDLQPQLFHPILL